ncbi:UDP-glucuronosyltransferase 2B19-like [Orbicella faveolata]|uniref:UDP-glucuronosyltransferase 2B19-like n=1 Tax=Orbicella faveolata TaxID=48498 RepID=UPI0009E4772B|nr:UDP-glucuronosyltransferase 2B19-like [Orbicella faveolata]
MWIDVLVSFCISITKHVKKHQEELKEFDLLFGDSPPACHVIIAEFLALPRIDIEPAFPMRLKPELSLVSYIPSLLSSNSAEMSFMERLQNLFFFGVMKRSEMYFSTRYGELKTEFNIMPERHFQVSIHMAEMTIIMGHFALEYPQPLLPATKLVGPLTVKPPSPLPQDLQQFISGAGDKGIILFSLGTLGDAVLQKHQVEMLVEVFGRLEQRIIWRLKRHIPEDLSSNIKVLPWIPQNDLLAHNGTKAFISHTGHNSLYEAAFYGVPLVCVPIFGDQPSNCIQAQTVGMAIGVDLKTVTGDEMYQSIWRILEEPSFKGNATRISRLMRDNPRTSVQQAADWIEYVHRHKGAKHLRPEVYNLHWCQYYLLDVVAFLLTAIFAFCFAIRVLFRLLWKIVTKLAKGNKTSKQE